jgi:carboxypeptidase family protein
MRYRARWVLVTTALLSAPLSAQVVRGRVTELNSTAPVPGALVSLLGAGDSTAVSVLTNREGDYALRALVPGRYRLAVKRIGVRRFVSEPFELAAGETRALDVPIDAVALSLPEVMVSGLCVTRQGELRRIAALWDEARTALQATEISLRDRLTEAQISRYAGELDPATLRVLFDWRSDEELLVAEPFTSVSGDSLSKAGYWRQLPGDSVEYLAPDASALASNAFILDHCFGIAGAPRGRPDLVGLTFVPARDRRLPDIAGTIWLDAKRFELRFIEFRYTRLPTIPNADRVGGEVHFARLASGAWTVDRWFIRMPQVVVRPDEPPRRQLREEGGAVIANGVASAEQPATLTGVYRDSAGLPVAGAVVRAIGTHRQTLTSADGSFRLDSLPPGGLSVAAHTDSYDSFAMLAATRRVDLQPGRLQRVELRAPNTAALRREACPVVPMIFTTQPVATRGVVRGVLRVLMVDSATAVPMTGVRFVASWPEVSELPPAVRHAVTDLRGAATFCDLPTGVPVEISLASAGGRTHVMMIELPRNSFVGRVVSGRINR